MCVWAQITLCVPTSAVNIQDSAVPLPTAATEDSDRILPQGRGTSSFLHSEPPPLVLAKPGSFLSFTFQFKGQLLRNALSDTCPNSGGALLMMIPPHPLYFLCQAFTSCSRFVLCVCHWVLSFSNQVCPYIIVSLALSRMACNRCSLHILGLTE